MKVGTIEVPLSSLEDAAQNLIKSQERKIKSLEAKVSKLQNEVARAEIKSQAYDRVRSLMREEFEFYGCDD